MKPNISTYTFIVILVVLNLVLAFYATPVTDLGDASTYILLSKTFLGEVNSINLQHRSPLFSIIMAGCILILKAPVLYKVMVVFQYILIAVTAWLVYLLFRRLFKRRELAMLVALLFNLSFSTIYFANILLTEILAVFLLTLSVFLLLHVFDQGRLDRIFYLGTAIGLLCLARFNAIPLIVPFFVLLNYILFRQKASLKKWVYSMVVFIFSYGMIINMWCLYNYHHNGQYQVFPGARIGIPKNPRNITIASIRPGNVVSVAHKPVLEIFLKAREAYLNRELVKKKGSMAGLDKSGVFLGLYSGYAIYRLALPELEAHYKLSESTNKLKTTPGFADFIKEIAAQNKTFIWKYRLFSLLNSFRPGSGGSLSQKYGNINLNILPPLAFKIFKLFFLFMSVFVFFSFFFFLVDTVKTKFKPDITLLTMFFIVFSFWGINFVFFTVGDSNRFKFPAEPLIIGLFIYYICELIRWIKAKQYIFS